MNIDALLPLFLKGNTSNPEMLKILSAIKCGDKNKAIEALLPKDKNNEQLLNILKMKGDKKPSNGGLGAIEGIASNEILGIMVKYYSYF